MGIYRQVAFADAKTGMPIDGLQYGPTRAVTVTISEPGLEWTATIPAEAWTEKRDNCFCCSCGDNEGSDSACRNHGHAGTRPCELHNMPGSPWEDSDEMPISVQQERARRG